MKIKLDIIILIITILFIIFFSFGCAKIGEKYDVPTHAAEVTYY